MRGTVGLSNIALSMGKPLLIIFSCGGEGGLLIFQQCIIIFSIAVDDSYQGPRLEEDLTPEFMKELLDWQKKEKKLHRKYAYKVYHIARRVD